MCMFTGSFDILCPDGYGYVRQPEVPGMEDINECIVKPGVCINGRCINTDGSYRCVCPPGYTLDSTDNRCVGEYIQPSTTGYIYLCGTIKCN